MDPQVQCLMAVLGLCDGSVAVLTGDAFLLVCFLSQLAFKFFLSSGIGIVLFLFHCHRMRAACEHFPAIHRSDY